MTISVFVLAAMLAPLEPDLVDVKTVLPDVVCKASYATDRNFTGRVVDGYTAKKCLISRQAAWSLALVQQELRTKDMTMIIYDAYRPQAAVDDFVRWAADHADTRRKHLYYPNVEKRHLFRDGYIAEKSGHSRGSTIDLSIGRVGSDRVVTPLDMGTRFDYFDPTSAGDSRDVSIEAQENRMFLRDIMAKYGFKPYGAEWWHFTLNNEPYPDSYFTVPVE